jgi:hypothetical protein
MHLEVAIPESLFPIQLLHNAHKVYITAVENFTVREANRIGISRTQRLMTNKELTKCREAVHRNQIGQLIVHLYSNADPLVWHTLNNMFCIS